VKPEIHIAGLTLKTFGIFFGLCFVAWGVLAAKRLKELGKPVDWAYEMVFVALAGGLVGARLYWVVQHYDEVKGDVLGNAISGTGLVWYGGLLGGVVTVVIWAWWRDFLNLALLDMAGPALSLGYAVGRIGCQVSGDGDYGIHSGLPWAMAYPDGTVPTSQEVHPTPIYETLSMGIVAWVLWRLRDSFRPGTLFALYLVCSGVERFLVEFVRRNPDTALGLTTPQLESLAIFAAGAVWLVLASRRGGLRPIAPAAA
jgi:phosphatidylglycerol---prolipoprotein diacylglyceryl transferase